MTDVVRKQVLTKLTHGDYNCEKEFTLAMFSGKYKLVILWELGHVKSMHFNELFRVIDGVTKKVLAGQLKELAADQLILRDAYMENNRELVVYRISDLGQTLLPIIDQMYQWGKQRVQDYQIPASFKLAVENDLPKAP
ncbi:winged helix-turn-helix transcriptional regulator [Lacticaseibacillus yichunensis]|uniref:Winged helix-turn-helix transcriptional regulator n=1 Tax=Lacticaseibacillus yichunensis TaxID=2486015 RepID=A0ABW4CR24_9LACO|nr:helix-turn-helix domain-containing protein [Lacticaseibacillus yichunensis]